MEKYMFNYLFNIFFLLVFSVYVYSLEEEISFVNENANISLGDTLTSLMIYQKAFEANSKSITTGDEFLKTAMDMIR